MIALCKLTANLNIRRLPSFSLHVGLLEALRGLVGFQPVDW